MIERRVAGIAFVALIAAGLSACGASGAPSPSARQTADAGWSYSEPSGDVEHGAAWSADGSQLVLTWSSDGCGPRLDPISVTSPTTLVVTVTPTDRACTAVDLPFIAQVATPEGVDQTKPVELDLPHDSLVIPPLKN
ncbi:hypothetical protein [Herbiconiux sp.]|uniref:hypothetical protein n=1 Tax=Herbiconiux sp. TaxID=1871186 RepID=UPI0025BCEDB0|nr:hypothetical protein [Herbiconiux sp.]